MANANELLRNEQNGVYEYHKTLKPVDKNPNDEGKMDKEEMQMYILATEQYS